MRSSLLPLLLFGASSLLAQQPYEAVVMGQRLTCPDLQPFFHEQTIEWVGTSRLDVDPRLSGMAMDGRGTVYVLAQRQPYVVQIARPDGSREPFAAGTGASFNIAATLDGRVYVLAYDGTARHIDRFSPAGTLEASYPLPASEPSAPLYATAIDVAPDGCTLAWISSQNVRDRIESQVYRLDGCTGAQYPRFSVSFANDVIALPGGGVLVAAIRNVRQYDANGTFVRAVTPDLDDYGLPTWRSNEVWQIAVRGKELWLVAGNCEDSYLLQVALDDGSELSRRPMVVAKLPDALAVPPLPDPNVPTLSSGVLVLLAVALATAGAFVVKFR